MLEVFLATAYAVVVWWISTGVILYLDGLPRRTFRWSVLGATVMGLVGLGALIATRGQATAASAYIAFTCAVLIWGWHELTFLTGSITGPRKHGCAPGCRGRPHFWHAVQAILHHELALLGAALLIAAICWRQPNQTGLWTFLLLYVLRLSAKLNLYLGVRTSGAEFLPAHLKYLATYFGERRFNALLPVSAAASVGLAWYLLLAGFDVSASPFVETRNYLLFGLTVLGVLEHAFFVMPMPATGLWGWSLRSRESLP